MKLNEFTDEQLLCELLSRAQSRSISTVVDEPAPTPPKPKPSKAKKAPVVPETTPPAPVAPEATHCTHGVALAYICNDCEDTATQLTKSSGAEGTESLVNKPPVAQPPFSVNKRDQTRDEVLKSKLMAVTGSEVRFKVCDAIYKAYPVSTDKVMAFRAIMKAIKDMDPAEVMKIVQKWAGLWKGADERELGFCPHCHTFFNDGIWLGSDEEWDTRIGKTVMKKRFNPDEIRREIERQEHRFRFEQGLSDKEKENIREHITNLRAKL